MSDVTREDVQRWVREELRVILDKGLMYSAESVNAPQLKAARSPQTSSLLPSLEDLTWEIMKPTEKGGWEKTVTKNSTYDAVVAAIKAKGGYPVDLDGFRVWLNDRDGSLGRRKKA